MGEGWTLEQWIDGCHAAEALNVRYRDDITRLTSERDEARAEVALLSEQVQNLEDALEQTRTERDRLRALLREVEWVPTDYRENEVVFRCPLCGAVREDRGDHVPFCGLAAALEGRDDH